MKRTFPASIDGQIFYIEEDAYQLLNSYLEQLHQSFKGKEGNEIVSDIESRIREHFAERQNNGFHVITFADVNNVIETMGRPEDLSEECEAPQDATQEQTPPQAEPFLSINLPGKKKLYRNMKNKVFGGVFGGLASYLGWNANIMRVLFIVLVLCTKVFPFAILYLIAWMIIPAAKTPRQLLEMNGEPVNVNTLGQAVVASTPTPPPYNGEDDSDSSSFFPTLFTILGKCVMGFFGAIALTISIACLIGLIAIATGGIAFYWFSDPTILNGFDMNWDATHMWAGIWFVICLLMTGTIVTGGMAWGAAAVVFNTKGLTKIMVGTMAVTVVLLIAASIILYTFH